MGVRWALDRYPMQQPTLYSVRSNGTPPFFATAAATLTPSDVSGMLDSDVSDKSETADALDMTLTASGRQSELELELDGWADLILTSTTFSPSCVS